MFFYEVSSIVQQIFGTTSKNIMSEDYLRAERQREGTERMFSQGEFDLCLSAIRSNILFPYNAGVPEPLREFSPGRQTMTILLLLKKLPSKFQHSTTSNVLRTTKSVKTSAEKKAV